MNINYTYILPQTYRIRHCILQPPLQLVRLSGYTNIWTRHQQATFFSSSSHQSKLQRIDVMAEKDKGKHEISENSSIRYVEDDNDDLISKLERLHVEESESLTSVVTSPLSPPTLDASSSSSSTSSYIEEIPLLPSKRDPLEEDYDLPTLKTVALWIRDGKCKNIMIVTGAGVSCSAGIPDFRSPGTGLYDNLQKYNLPYPEAVFDIAFYKRNPSPFVSLASELWPGIKYSPTLTHSFIALLHQKGLLLRNYTQNIDGLEILAGVSDDKLVECHGHFRTASCIKCGTPYDGDICKQIILQEQRAPKCHMSRCNGLVKPDIVFFGESLPTRFSKLLHKDLKVTDLLLVMGTSLMVGTFVKKCNTGIYCSSSICVTHDIFPFGYIFQCVAPVSLIPEMVDDKCNRVLFNRDAVGDFEIPLSYSHWNQRDIIELGDCDTSVTRLCDLLGWKNELFDLHKSRQLNNSSPDPVDSRGKEDS